jgi:hypothetical protein
LYSLNFENIARVIAEKSIWALDRNFGNFAGIGAIEIADRNLGGFVDKLVLLGP